MAALVLLGLLDRALAVVLEPPQAQERDQLELHRLGLGLDQLELGQLEHNPDLALLEDPELGLRTLVWAARIS